MATGAGLAVDDALVLAEELTSAHNINHPRCKAIVENSIQIGRYQSG